MKKKIFTLLLAFVSIFVLSAWGKNKFNLTDYIVEERNQLFTASDDIYNVTLSTGLRETNYCLDGVVNELTDFAILSLCRNDNKPLATDSYAYIVKIGEETITGFLNKNETDNNYSTDLELCIPQESVINVKISFTGYSFNKDLENTSNTFNIDQATALNIANTELEENIKNIAHSANIEVVSKIVKDFSSSDIKNYYWYVGVISNKGETLGILIDSNSGEIIAKKV